MTHRPPHDDPGRNLRPEDAETSTDTNIQQLKIVKVGTRGAEKVQLTGRVRFPYSEEIISQLRECVRNEGSTIGTNGKARQMAQDGGLLRHPSGKTEEGASVDAFPILLVDRQHAAEVAKKLAAALEDFAKRMGNVVSLGLVHDGQREILDMVTQEAKAKHRQTFPRARTELRLITGEETNEAPSAEPAVELNHETPAGNDQQREGDRNPFGADAARV